MNSLCKEIMQNLGFGITLVKSDQSQNISVFWKTHLHISMQKITGVSGNEKSV